MGSVCEYGVDDRFIFAADCLGTVDDYNYIDGTKNWYYNW